MKTLPTYLSIDQLPEYLNNKIELSDGAWDRVNANRTFLDNKIKSGTTYYGINTGFGSLCNVRVSDDQLRQLQTNLVCSHATGMGDEVPAEIVHIMLLLKIMGLNQGYSGIHPDTLNRLIYFYNEGITPVVYEQGSLGASGDLAPLAHLSLPLIGLGEVYYEGKKYATQEILTLKGIKALDLHAKEGLALLNGTQFMSSYAVWCAMEANKLNQWADIIATMSLEGFNGKAEPFSHPIHRVRPHAGQISTAAFVRSLLEDSQMQQEEKIQVQDPYSFRCIPQVHGATKDAVNHINSIFEIEINSVTDNPIVFEEEDMITSGGNFHGQPLALNLDFMAIAVAELANISERRTYLLISGQRDLPPFLAKNDPGLNSGFMIAQYAAAAIVSQNKQLCTPASVDSIVSSNGQEDHVSMGANAATKLKRVIDNVRKVLGVELMTAAQALDIKGSQKIAPKLAPIFKSYREQVAFYDRDRVLYIDMLASADFISQDPNQFIN